MSKICSRQSRIYPQMHLLNEDKRSLFGKFAFSKPISVKCRLRTKAVDYGLAAQCALIIKYLIMKHIMSEGKISMVENSYVLASQRFSQLASSTEDLMRD